MANFNSPKLTGEAGEQQVKRYVHQPLTIEHYGLHAKIQENGRVVITGIPVKSADGEIEFDEVEVPASFVFKIAAGLKMTREVKFVSVTEAKNLPDVED